MVLYINYIALAIDPFMGRARARAHPSPCARPALRDPSDGRPPGPSHGKPRGPGTWRGGWARAEARPMKGSIAIQPQEGSIARAI